MTNFENFFDREYKHLQKCLIERKNSWGYIFGRHCLLSSFVSEFMFGTPQYDLLKKLYKDVENYKLKSIYEQKSVGE